MPRNNECANNGKVLKDTSYKRHTGKLVAEHKNAAHLNMDEKMKLMNLMSQFSEIMQGTVGDYRNMEVAFEMDHTQHP